MPVTFRSLRVLPNLGTTTTGGFGVYWDIAGQNFTPTFMVQAGETESGPWVNALQAPTPNNFATGLGAQQLNMQALQWFQVQVLNGQTLVLTSPPMDPRGALSPRAYLQYRDILRRKRIYFDKTPTSPGWLLRRRIYGAKCTTCTDELIETPVSSDCLVCYGTGIIGGYYPLVEMSADWSAGVAARDVNTTLESNGPQQVQKARIQIFPVPDAKSFDIWIDQGTRYLFEIEKNSPEQWGGSIIAQILDISRLPAQHPAYNFPLPT